MKVFPCTGGRGELFLPTLPRSLIAGIETKFNDEAISMPWV